MARWHVWGDFRHTLPERIGDASLERPDDGAARRTADAQGFQFERRLQNGFEPWAALFVTEDDRDPEFDFAAYPIVRGWKRV